MSCQLPVWWTYGNAVGQGHHGGWRHGVLCVLYVCLFVHERMCVYAYDCVCVCWDESTTKLKDLMRHAECQ